MKLSSKICSNIGRNSFSKLNFSDVFHYPDFGGPNDVYFEMQEKFENISGAKARKLGKSIPELDRNAWDKAKYGIMKEVIKESFK